MKKTDILIVGGSAAGVTAAITARRFHPNADIKEGRSDLSKTLTILRRISL